MLTWDPGDHIAAFQSADQRARKYTANLNHERRLNLRDKDHNDPMRLNIPSMTN